MTRRYIYILHQKIKPQNEIQSQFELNTFDLSLVDEFKTKLNP